MLLTSVLVLGITAGAAVSDDTTKSTKITKVERLSKKTKKTKVTQFRDQHGKVLASAATDLRTEVQVDVSPDGLIRSIAVKPHDPTSNAEAQEMAAALSDEVVYERMGHFSEDELMPMPEEAQQPTALPRPAPFRQRLAALSGDYTHVFSADCLNIDHPEMYIDGCYERRWTYDSTPGYFYRLDSSFTAGKHRGTWGALKYIKSIHNYNRGYAGTSVVNWDPKYDYTREDTCTERSTTVERGGVSATSSTRVCPDKISPYRDDTYFRHGWYGDHSPGTYTGSPGHSVVKTPDGRANGFVYNITAKEDGVYEGETITWGR